MTFTARGHRSLDREVGDSGSAPDIAGGAALLQIGDSLGVIEVIGAADFTVADVAEAAGIPEQGAADYVAALVAAGLVVRCQEEPRLFRPVDEFPVLLHRAGYVSWAMVANRPFIDHAKEFLTDPERARARHLRDGRSVAVSSQWMGSLAFYPAAMEAIHTARPRRMVDLGSGTCRLLIQVLLTFPESTGVGLDVDGTACRTAERAALAAGVADRLRVYERPIQSIAEDPTPVAGADLVHGGFVFHDMLPEEEDVADRVLANCREAMPQDGIMAITDATPFPPADRERRFGTLVSYYHRQFMGRRLLTEEEWREKFAAAGFRRVDCVELGFPSGRLYLGHR